MSDSDRVAQPGFVCASLENTRKIPFQGRRMYIVGRKSVLGRLAPCIHVDSDEDLLGFIELGKESGWHVLRATLSPLKVNGKECMTHVMNDSDQLQIGQECLVWLEDLNRFFLPRPFQKRHDSKPTSPRENHAGATTVQEPAPVNQRGDGEAVTAEAVRLLKKIGEQNGDAMLPLFEVIKAVADLSDERARLLKERDDARRCASSLLAILDALSNRMSQEENAQMVVEIAKAASFLRKTAP